MKEFHGKEKKRKKASPLYQSGQTSLKKKRELLRYFFWYCHNGDNMDIYINQTNMDISNMAVAIFDMQFAKISIKLL